MFTTLVYLLGIFATGLGSQQSEFDKLCQSGLREDNTNYVYCSRQSLPAIPSFFSDPTQGALSIGVSNVFYDELVLSDNLIGRVEHNSFGKALKVRKLYLDQNPIRFIHDRAFENIRNYLEDLYLEQKVLDDQFAGDDSTVFESSIFQVCFNLHLLSIKQYRISELKPFQFLRMSKLQTLVLSNNQMRYISDNAFKGLEKSLTHLNLDSNLLEAVPIVAISNLKRLKTLNLSQNRIKALLANSFPSNVNLQSLDLSYNLLNQIDRDTFIGPAQKSLGSLDLQNNGLKWKDFVYLLKALHSLSELNLDFNQLAQPITTAVSQHHSESPLHFTFAKLKLKSLSLQGNRLSENDLRMLIEPTEKEGKVAKFQYSFRSIQKYESKIEYERFSYPALLKLNLARNKIKNVPAGFFKLSNMSSLEALVLDRNPLESARITASYFSGLEDSLVSLSLNSAGVNLWSPSSIEAFMRLGKLQSLKLNGNTQREESLSVNALKRELNAHERLSNLTSLELQNNNLKVLPSFVCQLRRLSSLDLSSNALAGIDLDCFRDGQKAQVRLSQLNLNNNPLKCDCKLRELKAWLMGAYDKDLIDLIMWECSNLNRRYLVNVDLHEMVCEVPTTSTVLLRKPTVTMAATSTTTQQPTTTAEKTTKTSTITAGLVYVANLESETSTASKLSQLVSHPGDNLDISYFSLIIGISLAISAVCLVILVFFYFNCMQRAKTPEKRPTFQPNTKYDSKFHSPNSSTTSSTATGTTLATGSHNQMIQSDDSFSSLTHSNNELLLKQHKCPGDIPHSYHNFYDTTNPNKCHCKTDSFQCLQAMATFNQNRNVHGYNFNTSLPLKALPHQNVFTISNSNRQRQHLEPVAIQNDPHIYHEINTPVKFAENYPQPRRDSGCEQYDEYFSDNKLFLMTNPILNGYKLPMKSHEIQKPKKQYLANNLGQGMIV